MGTSNQIEAGIKLSAVREYLAGNGSLNKISKKYGVCRSTLQKWLLNYELFGETGLQHRLQNQHYPEGLKRQAVDTETDKMEDILPLLKPTMEYREEGFSGVLALNKSSVQAKAAGTSSYAYQMKETKEFTGLNRNDLAYIPKTAEKNGVTLKLADVEWTPMASGAENSEVPSLFSATALYTGTAWGSKADGYTVTAEYTGEVSRMAEGQVLYSIVYEEIMPEGSTFPWRTIVIVMLFAVLGAGVGTGIR